MALDADGDGPSSRRGGGEPGAADGTPCSSDKNQRRPQALEPCLAVPLQNHRLPLQPPGSRMQRLFFFSFFLPFFLFFFLFFCLPCAKYRFSALTGLSRVPIQEIHLKWTFFRCRFAMIPKCASLSLSTNTNRGYWWTKWRVTLHFARWGEY